MRISRRAIRWSVAGVLATLALLFAIWRVGDARCFTLAGSVTCRVETDAPIVALTFDDGPTHAGLAAVLPLLDRYGAKATFFLIGSDIERRPELVRTLLAAGHEVGNHSFSHRRMIGRSAQFYDEEIARTDAALRRAGAPHPQLFRPPFGKKLFGLPRAVDRHGYRMITWSVDDPAGATSARAYADAVLRDAGPGAIILMHVMYPANRTAREALPLILAGLRDRGLRAVTVTELLRREASG